VKHLIILCLFFFSTSNIFSYWPGKWDILDQYIEKNNLAKPQKISTVTKDGTNVYSLLKFDMHGRILKEIIYQNNKLIGKTEYDYKNHLKEIRYYDQDNQLLSKLEYSYNKNCLNEINLIENKIKRKMVIKCLSGKLIQGEVFNSKGELIDKIKLNYNKKQLKEILYFQPNNKKAEKVIQYFYANGNLVKRERLWNKELVFSKIKYKNNSPVKIEYFDINNNLKRLIKLEYSSH
jgi:hypothetical protein